MPKPAALRPGATVRIVSPASPLPREKLDVGLALLDGWGYRAELAPHALDSDDHLAGSDEARAQDLRDAFLDPAVDAIWCSRGGYGCARLMERLDIEELAASPKLFAGFSDITTLHLALNQAGLPTLHAPMPLTLTTPREPWVVESLRRAWIGDVAVPDDAPGGECVVPGEAEGRTVGGCLCLLTDSLATAYPLRCEERIVILEDVDESPHRIDAMLTHLLNEGSIRKAAGIVVGEMTRTDERIDEGIGGRPWKQIVRERLEPLGVPMIVEFPLGHSRNMLTVPLGVRARLNAEAGTLTFLESPCELP